MNQLNKITYEEIEMLNQLQLTELLLMLLRLEANRNSLFQSGIDVPLKIDVSDGGEDGRIKWHGGSQRTDWIPDRFTIFQCKATKMPAAKCKAEVCKEKSKELKDRVKEVLDAGGTYVLFYGRQCNTHHCHPRIKAIRTAIGKSGANYAKTAKIEIYDAQRIANWCNQYAAAVACVCEGSGFQLPVGLKTWRELANFPDHRFQFFTNQILDASIKQLRSAISQQKAIVRVEGLSGLGKTRLVLEAFRASDTDLSLQAIRDSVVYCNASILAKEIVVFATDPSTLNFQPSTGQRPSARTTK